MLLFLLNTYSLSSLLFFFVLLPYKTASFAQAARVYLLVLLHIASLLRFPLNLSFS